MARQPDTEAVRQSLSAQVAAQGAEIHQKYGPELGWHQLLQLLQDRSCVRFPCDICFDAGPLLPGEFAHPVPKGATPAEGYTIFVHPLYSGQLARVPYLVLPQLVLVNHGELVSADDAETFGSRALGLTKEDFYQALCALSNQIGGDELV